MDQSAFIAMIDQDRMGRVKSALSQECTETGNSAEVSTPHFLKFIDSGLPLDRRTL
jgi:hypothetical protein